MLCWITFVFGLLPHSIIFEWDRFVQWDLTDWWLLCAAPCCIYSHCRLGSLSLVGRTWHTSRHLPKLWKWISDFQIYFEWWIAAVPFLQSTILSGGWWVCEWFSEVLQKIYTVWTSIQWLVFWFQERKRIFFSCCRCWSRSKRCRLRDHIHNILVHPTVFRVKEQLRAYIVILNWVKEQLRVYIVILNWVTLPTQHSSYGNGIASLSWLYSKFWQQSNLYDSLFYIFYWGPLLITFLSSLCILGALGLKLSKVHTFTTNNNYSSFWIAVVKF